MRKFFALLVLAMALASCSQVNTLYNARKYFKAAQARPLNANGRPNNQAVEEYTKAIQKCGIILSNEKRDRRTDDALFLMARALYYKGNSAFQAKDQFESLLKGFGDSPFVGESHIYLAKVMREINQKEQSYKVMQEFVLDSQHKKLHPRALMTLAQFSIADKDYLQAQFWLQKILTEYPKSEEYREAFFIFGQNYYIEKDYGASLAEFNKISKDRRIPQQMKLDARYYIAMNQFMLGEYEQCKKTLKKLLKDEVRPEKQSLARVLQARLFLAEGEADKGLAEIESIGKTYPRTQSSAEAQYHLAEYYFYEAQDLEKAGTAYGRVRTEFANSELAEPGQQRSTAVNQLKNKVKLNPESNLQAYVDYCISGAENYFNVFSLPDSALVLYDRLISSREIAVTVRDSVMLEFDAKQAVVDSLELALQALPEPEPEPEPAVQESFETSEDSDEEDVNLDELEAESEPEEHEPETITDLEGGAVTLETEPKGDDTKASEPKPDELESGSEDDGSLESEEPPDLDEEPEELESEVNPDVEDEATPSESETSDTDPDEADPDTEELLGDQEENDPEPTPVSNEADESDAEDVDDPEQEEVEPEPSLDETELDSEPEIEKEVPQDQEEPTAETERIDIPAEPSLPDLQIKDLPGFDLNKPESLAPDSLDFELADEEPQKEAGEEKPVIDEEAEARRQIEAQRKELQRNLTSAKNDLDRVQKRLDALDAVLLRYDRELVPLALFSKATILNKIGPDREQMEAIYADMLEEFPSNKYTNALEDMLAGEPVRLIDPEEEAQEILMEEALGLADSDPSAMISRLEELAASEYPPISLKATFRLAWYYSFELPDTTAAKPYLSKVLEMDRNGEYGSLTARFFDGTKFKFPKDEPADSLAQSDSLATDIEKPDQDEAQDLAEPEMDSEKDDEAPDAQAVDLDGEQNDEPPPQRPEEVSEAELPQEDVIPVSESGGEPPPEQETESSENPEIKTPDEDSPEAADPQELTEPETELQTDLEEEIEEVPEDVEPEHEGENPIDQEDGQAE